MKTLTLLLALLTLPTVALADNLGTYPSGGTVPVTLLNTTGTGTPTQATDPRADIFCGPTKVVANAAMTLVEAATTGTATGGTTTTLADTARTEATGIWVGYVFRQTAGSNIGLEAIVTASVSGTLTFAPELPFAVAASDTYALFKPLYVSNWTVTGVTDGTGCTAVVSDVGSGTVAQRHAFVVDTVGGGGSSLTAQQVADAMQLLPGGIPAAGSINQKLDTITSKTRRIR